MLSSQMSTSKNTAPLKTRMGSFGGGGGGDQAKSKSTPTTTMARNQVLKSASVEANNYPSIRCSSISLYKSDDLIDNENPSSQEDLSDLIEAPERNLLTIGSTLKPSISTSCLASATEQESSHVSGSSSSTNESASSVLVCIPTRASLTHEWKKLKTPNKCRECNLLVYFNGRECSFCGFVAHKKCVTILVIKCSGQHVATGSHLKGSRLATSAADQARIKDDKHNCDNSSSNNTSKQSNQPTLKSFNNSIKSQILFHRNKTKSRSIKPIFGQAIDDSCIHVIDFLRRFIYEIDTRGLASKGIYRVSSIKSKVDRLCGYYNQNLSSLIDLSSFHPNIIANALKMYLRQLPEPLLTDKLYNKFIDLAKSHPNTLKELQVALRVPSAMTTTPAKTIRQRKSITTKISEQSSTTANDPFYDPALIAEFRELLEELPPINRELIAILMRHLRRVADMADENQMSARNLSIIFGPTLLSANNKSLAIADNIHQARAVELMIIWANQIFPQYANYESSTVIELNLSGD